jgi:glycerol-3-phosphate acyltransferase PlsY
MNIVRLILGCAFLMMGIAGLIGHFPPFRKNFRNLPGYQHRFGIKIGSVIHFTKVCILNLLLAYLILFPPF